MVKEEAAIVIQRGTIAARVSGREKFVQQGQILLAAGKWADFNGDIPVFPPGPFLTSLRFKFNGNNADRDTCPAIRTVHIIDNIAVAAITRCKVCAHDKIRHGVNESLVVNCLKRKTIGTS